MPIRTVVKHNNFAKIATEVRRAPAAAINEALIDLRAGIQEAAPVGSTGQLHSKFKIERAKHTHDGWRGRLFMVFYWRFVNYGGHGVPARPFVEPSAELVQIKFTAKVRAIFARRF